MDMYRLESDQLILTVLPERGGKIANLFFKPTQAELLWQPAADNGADEFAPGITFGARQAWGWDEMFPAIQPETFDAQDRRFVIPDHGEVWTRPWRVIDTNEVNTLTLGVTNRSAGYDLTRKTVVTGATVRHDYTLTNTGDTELPWIWAAHPLFSLKDEAELLVPAGWSFVRNAYDSPAMPEYDRLYPYPGSEPHLGKLAAPDSDLAFKYYFEDPNTSPENTVVLSQPTLGLDIRVQADPHVAPWFGIWWNAGGLFGHNNVAIEPASAPMDSLSAARRLDRLPLLPPHAHVSWWMVVSVGSH